MSTCCVQGVGNPETDLQEGSRGCETFQALSGPSSAPPEVIHCEVKKGAKNGMYV